MCKGRCLWRRQESRADRLAFRNDPRGGLSREDIMKIRKSPADIRRRQFMSKLQAKAERSETYLKNVISELDSGRSFVGDKKYAGGCKFLIRWYRSLVVD